MSETVAYVFVIILLMQMMKPALACIDWERHALLSVKDELIDNYDRLSSWGSEEDKKDCCKWAGITCSNLTGHVTTLDLHVRREESSYNPLGGKISHSLLQLTHLAYLDLGSNDFGGSQFPNNNGSGSLAELRYLSLFNANLTGTISYFARNLSNLQYLDLTQNHFTDDGNIEWVFGLSSLSYLNLRGIPLVRPSSWLQIIDRLPNLEILILSSCFSGNQTTLSISPINSSSSLSILDISRNYLVIPSILPWLSNISQTIVHLDLSSNSFLETSTSTLASIGKMASLQSIHLRSASLVGGVPKSIGNISRLSYLDLSSNNLDVPFSELIQNLSGCTLKTLEHLNLDSNELTGSLPDLSGFSSLRHLHLQDNRLNGTIDKSLGRLYMLERLTLGFNSLNGLVTEYHFSHLINLRDLILSGNSLVWNVSLNWIPPFRLDILHLQSCKLGPHFPKWLQSQTNYSELDISDNGISDSIPKWFWSLSSAPFYLNLSHNQFSGSLPDEFVHLQNLLFLNLANNSFGGEIPISIGSLFKLETLNLANNDFSGEVPSSLKNCTMLRFLDLSGNRLSGNLPASIGESLSSLQFLSLRFNHFRGSIPLQVCQLTNVQILDLSVNNISGTIPHCLKNLKAMTDGNSTGAILHSYIWSEGSSKHHNFFIDKALVLWKGKEYGYDKNLGLLRIIDLSHNKIEGMIPSEISSLTKLKQLNLSRNMLTGEIPQGIGCLKQLESLDLSQNQLTGRIPSGMASLNFLNTLNLSYNHLSGRIPSSTQLQSFHASAYTGNPALCGLPLLSTCPNDTDQVPASNHDDEDEYKRRFYAGMALGFFVCFCGVSGSLLLYRSWRNAYFQLLDKLVDWPHKSMAGISY